MALAVGPPVGGGGEGAEQPEQGAGEVDPDGALHAPYVGVALGVLADVQAPEDAEQRDPQHEEDEAPGRHRREAQDEGEQVEEGGHGREGPDYYRVDLVMRGGGN